MRIRQPPQLTSGGRFSMKRFGVGWSTTSGRRCQPIRRTRHPSRRAGPDSFALGPPRQGALSACRGGALDYPVSRLRPVETAQKSQTHGPRISGADGHIAEVVDFLRCRFTCGDWLFGD